MTKRLKLILGLAAVCGAALVCAACSADGSPYKNLNKKDFKISVIYDNNGGLFASQENINVVDVYPQSAVKDGKLKLLEPGSDDRGGGTTQSRSQISRSGYFLAGWYQIRELRFQDEAKTVMLDENGEVTADPEKQGYTYSGKWNFETDYLEIDPNKKYSSDVPALTLYAAWVPNYKYEIYMPASNGTDWDLVGTSTFNPTVQEASLDVPRWNDESGKMDYGKFPQASGKTFSKVYSDSTMTSEITSDSLSHDGTMDEATATAVNVIKKYYTTWQEGVWFKIRTAKQLFDNAMADGCYEILDNLDFTEEYWPAGFSGDYSGKIVGNNHTISNVTVEQNDNTVRYGGLFGRVMDKAEIKDITFNNVTYKMNAGSRYPGASFGLFAGGVLSGAKIENVKISGEIQIGNIFNLRSNNVAYAGYTIKLVVGEGDKTGITYDKGAITCKSVPAKSGTSTIYPVIVTVDEEEETVTVTQNPDTSKNPYEGSQD